MTDEDSTTAVTQEEIWGQIYFESQAIMAEINTPIDGKALKLARLLLEKNIDVDNMIEELHVTSKFQKLVKQAVECLMQKQPDC